MKSRQELAQYFNKLGFTYGAEIGVGLGRGAVILCQGIPDLKLICVDNWVGKPNNYEFTRKRLNDLKYKVIFIRKNSMEAVKDITNNSLDFVFIDANHQYQYVMEDITEWSKKVRPSGIVAGHDYYTSGKVGVKKAVNDYTRLHNIKFELTEISIRTQSYTEKRDNEEPCYYWVKKGLT